MRRSNPLTIFDPRTFSASYNREMLADLDLLDLLEPVAPLETLVCLV